MSVAPVDLVEEVPQDTSLLDPDRTQQDVPQVPHWSPAASLRALSVAAGLDVARQYLGNVGGAPFKLAFGLAADSAWAWCAIFQWATLTEAGVQGLPKTAWTPNWVSWARSVGIWRDSSWRPSPGDLVLFMWSGVSPAGRGTPPVCHIGRVEYVSGVRDIYTIEGNTSSAVGGVQYDGNTVARKHRTGSVIQGYVDMSGLYDGSTVVPVVTVVPALDEDGVRGSRTITRWQAVMGTPQDGVISKPESTLIRADQTFLNSAVPANIQDLTGKQSLVLDGAEGPLTIKVRQFWLYNTVGPAVLHRPPTVADFDGIAGEETTTLHQHALNLAAIGSGRY